MDEHRVTGAANNTGSKVEHGFGRVSGDTKTQVEGMIDQAQDTAEKFYGQAKDAAKGVRKTAVSFEDTLHHTIQNKPYHRRCYRPRARTRARLAFRQGF